MGDALLGLKIGHNIYTKYGKGIDFYSKYNFEKYLTYPFVDKTYTDTENVFSQIKKHYDIIIDLDLSYENLTNDESFYSYYESLFEVSVLDKLTNSMLQKIENNENAVCLVNEGSGWGGKEYSLDIGEMLAYTLKEKGFKVLEPGINRISHYADETNPEKNFDKLFEMALKSKFYVGTDSGVAHICNLAGLPCFVIGGAADPNKTLYNENLIYAVLRSDLLCIGCRHKFKGFKTLHDGASTFVASCYNTKIHECMNFNVEEIQEELERFLIKYDLVNEE